MSSILCWWSWHLCVQKCNKILNKTIFFLLFFIICLMRLQQVSAIFITEKRCRQSAKKYRTYRYLLPDATTCNCLRFMSVVGWDMSWGSLGTRTVLPSDTHARHSWSAVNCRSLANPSPRPGVGGLGLTPNNSFAFLGRKPPLFPSQTIEVWEDPTTPLLVHVKSGLLDACIGTAE